MMKFLQLKCAVLMLCLVVFTGTIQAQERTVTGKVTSAEDGSPVPGVNVTIKGTTQGTVTDANGGYRLTASGGTLVFSFIGFLSQEASIGERSQIDVVLQPDITQLSEVVVVGYGTQNRREISGSIATLPGDDIRVLPNQSFEQALGGRAAGVQITVPNGVLNNPPVIRVRGVNSISLSSFPLIIIDGIPTFSGNTGAFNSANNPLASINPADIESIEILKDASAAAIYGSRASAGVILITTKRGKQGKSKITLDSWVGITKPFNLVELLNAEQYMEIKNEGMANAGLAPGFFPNQDANGNNIDTNWYDYVYQTGVAHNNNISFSGGTNSTNYFLSIGHTQQDGMIRANSFDRTTARLNLDNKVNEWIKVGVSMNFSNSMNRAANTGSLPGETFNSSGLARLAFLVAPNVGPYLNDGSYNITSDNSLGRLNNTQPVGFRNPEALIKETSTSSENNHIQASIYANWEPIKGLNFRSTYGVDRMGIQDIRFRSPVHGDAFGTGDAGNTYLTINRWNWQNTAQYDKQVADKHSFSILVGGEQQYTDNLRWGAQRSEVADPFFTSYQGNFTTINPLGSLQGENYLVSYFGRFTYDFSKKYYLTFNLRNDGYSAFAPGLKYGTFYGVSGAYVVSEEDFFKNSSLGNKVSFLKLRASHGSVGNTQGIDDFASLQLYNSGLYGLNPTLFYSQPGNIALQWENSLKTDLGVEFGLMQDRIQAEVVYYKNEIKDMILGVPQAPSKGIPGNPGNQIDQNIGSMINTGVEISLRATVIRKKDFSWNINTNFTTLKNEVTQLAGSDIRTATGGLETANITRVGESIGSLLVVQTAGVNPENGRRIFVKGDGTLIQYDQSASVANRWTEVLTGNVTTAPNVVTDGVVMGPTLPSFYGGFDNTFRYKNFDLGVFLQFSGGNYIYNGTQAGLRDQRFWNNHTDVLNRWTPENPNGTIPRIVYNDNVSNGSTMPISENVQKGDFMRARNLMLGYTLDRNLISRLNIESLRVYAQVQNAFILTKYTGFDPEISTNGNSTTGIGIDRNSVGQARTFTFGLTLGL